MASREEELQKKREEAERKARRGEIDPTHEFTFQVIKGFNIFFRVPWNYIRIFRVLWGSLVTSRFGLTQ